MSTVHLASFDAARLERLLEARPDLLTAGSLEEIARLASSSSSARLALADLPAPARQVAEALSLLGEDVTLDDLCLLDPHVDRDALQAAVEDLRTRLLVKPGARLHLNGAVRQDLTTPLGLGRPVVQCFDQTSYYALCQILAAYDEPRPRSGEAARHALARVFAHPALLAESFEGMPADLLALLRRADADGPVLRISGVDPTTGVLPDEPGLRDAVLTGMLAVIGTGRIELPREIGLALRWPAVTRFALTPPVVASTTVPASEVAAACGAQVHRLLDAVDALGAGIQVRPVPLLGSGGVGVKEVRALAAGGDPSVVSLLLRLLEDLGLVAGGRKDLRMTKAWTAWSGRDEAERWTDLVRAWLACRYLPAARTHGERKLKAALGWDFEPRLPGARQQLVRLLGGADGGAHDERGWLDVWHHRWPERRLTAYDGRGHLVDRELRADLLHEAEALGLLAAGAVSPLARAVHQGDEVAPVLDGLSEAGEQRVKAQADMTLVCTGRPSRTMRVALDRLADVEQSGAATVWRVSEQSLSRAYDQGDTPDAVHAVLVAHAGEIPQAMAYLVKDAHRRHGQVRVGAATSYVVVEDDVRLQDALLRRGTAAKSAKTIGLRRIAPGVAVSKGSVAATVAALKELGLAAVPESAAAARPAVKTAPDPTRRPVPSLPVLDLSPLARELAGRLAGRPRP